MFKENLGNIIDKSKIKVSKHEYNEKKRRKYGDNVN